jgi:hypothetical protein
MKATENVTLPGQKEAIVHESYVLPRAECLLRKAEERKKAEGVEDWEVPDHVYATYWG